MAKRLTWKRMGSMLALTDPNGAILGAVERVRRGRGWTASSATLGHREEVYARRADAQEAVSRSLRGWFETVTPGGS